MGSSVMAQECADSCQQPSSSPVPPHRLRRARHNTHAVQQCVTVSDANIVAVKLPGGQRQLNFFPDANSKPHTDAHADAIAAP